MKYEARFIVLEELTNVHTSHKMYFYQIVKIHSFLFVFFNPVSPPIIIVPVSLVYLHEVSEPPVRPPH